MLWHKDNSELPAFQVLEPGAMTTVQDLGRFGFQAFGVPVSGALDQFSARVANWLVGNPSGAALLEVTFMGPKLKVQGDCQVAVTGAEVQLLLNGKEAQTWRALRVRPGDEIWVRQAKAGMRAYLAVTGGVEVPLVMGSRSTYVGARLGGLEGRPLKKGDVILRGSACPREQQMRLPDEYKPLWNQQIRLRTVLGPQEDFFEEGLKVFLESQFLVSPQIDRMGYRLDGPQVHRKPEAPQSIISEPSLPGAVQIPPDGKPIVLLVEQTVGGYAKIATVIWPDLPFLAQARPGDRIRFSAVTLAEAHQIYREFMARLEAIRMLLEAPAENPFSLAP
ncbi:MAG: biotin-dependent carboxyltransferase family protein [bacterium]